MEPHAYKQISVANKGRNVGWPGRDNCARQLAGRNPDARCRFLDLIEYRVIAPRPEGQQDNRRADFQRAYFYGPRQSFDKLLITLDCRTPANAEPAPEADWQEIVQIYTGVIVRQMTHTEDYQGTLYWLDNVRFGRFD